MHCEGIQQPSGANRRIIVRARKEYSRGEHLCEHRTASRPAGIDEQALLLIRESPFDGIRVEDSKGHG